MYVQNNYYSPEEYGTRDVPEYREPCGAFYGMPFAGEGEQGERNLYDLEQVRDFLPDRWFSDKDERVLAHLRGEWKSKDEEKEDAKAKNNARFRMMDVSKRNIYDRARELAREFVLKSGCNTTCEARKRMANLLERYFEYGERFRLNEICDMFELYCGIRIPRYK